MVKYRVSVLAGVLALLLLSCNLDRPDADYDKVNAEIKENKIRRHKESEIISTAYESGKVVKEMIEKQYGYSVDTINPANLCMNEGEFKLKGKLSKKLYSSIQLYCTAPPQFNEKQKLIWDAYKKTAKFDTKIVDNIQYIREGNFYFYSIPYRYENAEGERKMALIGVEIDKKETILSMQRNS